MSNDNQVPGAYPAERWILSAVEPLLSTRFRQQLDDAMIGAIATAPVWGAAWFGGVISDMMQTLPLDDPWRSLDATVTYDGWPEMRRGDDPPDVTGATLEGRPFGTYRDAADMSAPMFEDPTIDVAVVALLEPLTPLASALLAFGADGWANSITVADIALRDLGQSPTERLASTPEERAQYAVVAGKKFFDAASQALRWSIHRRKSYGLIDDPWPLESGWNWTIRAAKIAQGKPWAASDLELAINAERIASESIDP